MSDPLAELLARAAGTYTAPEPDVIPEPTEYSELQKAEAKAAYSAWAASPERQPRHAEQSAASLGELHQDPRAADAPLLKIPNFLPKKVALGMMFTLTDAADWCGASAGTDNSTSVADGAGTTRHNYAVGDGDGVVDAISVAVQALLPSVHCAFQAGRYSRGHFIEPHDDLAWKQHNGKRYKRTIALIYYMTRDWDSRLGGSFMDLQTCTEYVPSFNSLVAFRVPRLHEVSKLETDRCRYSVFGWFYEPDDDDVPEATEGPKKRKKGSKKKNAKKRKTSQP